MQAGPFQIGPPLPPTAAHRRPNLYGQFTVNLGVFVPEIYERTNPPLATNRAVTDAHCDIRTRLGRTESHEIWWSLASDVGALVDDIGALLIDEGIPFLERFGSRHAIIRDWVKFNDGEWGLTSVARLDTAMIVLRQGDIDAARQLFQDHLDEYRKNPINPGHGTYVRELALRLGLGQLS